MPIISDLFHAILRAWIAAPRPPGCALCGTSYR